ncbi:glycosyltransferase family 2 protein [Verrucomicrobium spinosum]|uniref:glycosyltransferase family 2 protein n=1 Tax=Verrucomicrobium spinosum TaxID=2736 RepID=UPI0001746422|nr:hypothetical protein [Verrucomicrobium spinosum]
MNIHQYFDAVGEDDLTIISVSFRSASLLRQNLALTRKLNPDTRVHWMVVQNTPAPDNASDLQEDDPDFYVIPGPRITKREKSNVGYGSFHHGKALNMALSYAITSHILLLDPDCFIVKDQWIREVPALMRRKQFCFWGTPYHPERLNAYNVFGRTYMYFPTAICMFIDRARLQKNLHFGLDFTPPVRGKINSFTYRDRILNAAKSHRSSVGKAIAIAREAGIRGLVDVFRLTNLKWAWDKRPDIGHLVYEQYHKKVKVGYTAMHYSRPFPAWFKLLKALVPQHCTAYPKRNHYWTKQTFAMLPPEVHERWEQFFIRDEPFAFHLGKVTYNPHKSDAALLAEVLSKQFGLEFEVASEPQAKKLELSKVG